MEIHLNILLLATLLVAFASMTTADPVSAMAPSEMQRELAALEDASADHPDDAGSAQELAERYLELGRPALAISALSAVDSDVRRSPAIAHRLAQAYEAAGRVPDALATARLALSRCARALGSADAPSVAPTPAYRCPARDQAVFGMHVAALAQMVRWGVEDPRTDPRARLAHDMSERRARIAMR